MQPSRLRTIRHKASVQQVILNAGEHKPSTGQTEQKEYIIGKPIGSGRIAKVYEATHSTTGHRVAIKIIPKFHIEDSQCKQKLVREIELQKELDHHNIMKLEHAFEDSNNIYIVLELCANKTLEEVAKSRHLTESEVQKILLQLIDAIKYLHGQKIIHRNIKLANIFLTETMKVSLGGFRLAAKLGSSKERRFSMCGNLDFVAPEVINKTGYSAYADIWSFGVAAYQLLVGKLPFKDASDSKIASRIRNNKFSFPSSTSISASAKDFINNLLVLQPESRLSIREIVHHPFLNPARTSSRQSFTETWSSIQKMSSFNSGCSKDTTDSLIDRKVHKSLPILGSQSTKNSDGIADPSLWSLNSTPQKMNPNAQGRKFLKSFTVEISSRLDNSPKADFSPVSFKIDGNDLISMPTEENEPVNKDTSIIIEEPTLGLCVTKWIDYSSKYGLGYVLSDNTLGVIFNDNTQILETSNQGFKYFNQGSTQAKDQGVIYTLSTYPSSLERKVKLYKYFIDYLRKDRSGVSSLRSIALDSSPSSGDSWNGSVSSRSQGRGSSEGYVQSWMKTDCALFFKFSTKFVQVVFKDETMVMINPYEKSLVYVGSKGDRRSLRIDDMEIERSAEISKRVGYVQKKLKDVWKTVNSMEI